MDRAELLARKTKKDTDTVTLSDGASVKIRKLSQAEVDHARRHYGSVEKGAVGMRYVVARGALNDDGTQMFTDADMTELEALPFDDVNTLALAIGKFSGTTGPNA